MKTRASALFPKFVRLGCFLLFTQIMITLVVAHRVHADVQNLMLSVGSQMMQLGERVPAAPPRTIRLNGAQIRLRVQHVPGLSLSEVLDHFQARCRDTNGRFYEQLHGTRAHGTKLSPEQLGLLDGVIRVDAKQQGAVACLDVGAEKGSPSTLLARAERFVATGDASSFGDLRYVRAEERGNGVFVVMMWTDGPLKFREMFPGEGDVPGLDFAALPRPPGSRRILSAWEEGEAPALNIYEAGAGTPDSLDAHYRSELPRQGWQLLTKPMRNESRASGLMAMREGITVTLSHVALKDGRSMTTILPMDMAGAAAVKAP
jgi:hypothetical protein